MVGRDDVLAWIRALQAIYAENKTYLTDLDSAIGDADHGINMDRGFTSAVAEMDKSEPADIAGVLKSVAMVLIRTVGGAAGPLYGTFFLRASAACAGKEELEPADIAGMLEGGLQGVIQRGKAELEDKTMVDALTPALNGMKQALGDGGGLEEMLERGVAAAEQGMKDTIPMLAKKGRASYLGERSIGHQDPGATSSYLMLDTMSKVFRKA